MTKNLDELLSTLERGPLPYTELQERSAIPQGSFSRVVGQAIQSGQVVNQDGKYRLARAPYGINHTQQAEDEHALAQSDTPAIENEPSPEALTITDGSATVGTPTIFRVGKRQSAPTGGLRATITNPDGSTETISWEEHRRRKGYA